MQDFQEKEFYHDPPASDASPEEWEQWMEREKKSRAAHKAQHTKSLEHNPEGFDDIFHSSGVPVKVNGVFRQQEAFVGFSGSKEEGTLEIEPGVAEDQERTMAIVHMEQYRNRRGHRSRNRNARRRKNRKARR